jgi:hypothetical protein
MEAPAVSWRCVVWFDGLTSGAVSPPAGATIRSTNIVATNIENRKAENGTT